jgi:hypothetical protein
VQSSCAIDAVDPAAQASGSITCQAAAGQPQLLWLVSYASAEAMSAELDDLVGTPESDDCTTRPSRGEWSLNGVLVGELACFASEAGNTIVWGSDAQGVLVLAADQTWSPEDLYVWWQNDAPFLQ